MPNVADDLYAYLMRHAPVAADAAFDAHVVASILAAAYRDAGSAPAGSGLAPEQLRRLIEACFADADPDVVCAGPEAVLDEEAEMVRDLLLAHCDGAELAVGLATMIAQRAMAPNHLWEDLGLRDRGELSKLLTRHFAPLAARNSRNMRWKRFFYRSLCEAEGFVLCTTPVCTQCNDFDLCFGEETSEARMAEAKRTALRAA